MKNFTGNEPVWLTRNNKRFRAVADEPPGDQTIYSFVLEVTRELVDELTNDEFERLNTFSSDTDERTVVWFPDTTRLAYIFLGTDGFDEAHRTADGDWVDDDGESVSEYNMLWDDFAVSQREVTIAPGSMSNRHDFTETDTGTTWEVYNYGENAYKSVFTVDYRSPPCHIGYAEVCGRRIGFRFKDMASGDEGVDEYVVSAINNSEESYKLLARILPTFGVTHVLDTELFSKPIPVHRWARHDSSLGGYLADSDEDEIIRLLRKSLEADAAEVGDDDPCYDRIYVSRKSDTEVSIGDNYERVSFYIIHKNGEWFTRRRRDGLDGPITFDEAKKLAGNYWNN